MTENTIKEKVTTISVSHTEGLTSIEQIVDSTSNEIFSFKDNTSDLGDVLLVLPPYYEVVEKKPEKRSEDFFKEFKSIVDKKLKKPIDLKELYYNQMEHL